MKRIQKFMGLTVSGLLLLVALLFVQTAHATPITFSFSDKDFFGGASWGTLTVSAFDADSLELRYDAAPSSIIPAGSQATGFGFTFNPTSLNPSISNPTNSAFTGDRDDLNWIKLTNLNAIPNPSNGDEFVPQVTKESFFYGVTEGNAGNLNPPGILPGEFDVFYMNFTGITDLTKVADLSSIVALTGVRIQSLPTDVNGGSIFLAGDPDSHDVPVPEPATMLLLGSGLVGLAAYGRKKFRK